MAFHLDYETYSAADLKKVGAFRYAADPSSEILMLAIAIDDEEPLIWVPEEYRPPGVKKRVFREAYDLMAEMAYSDEPIFAHNAQFEHAVSKYLWKKTTGLPRLDINRWRCTAAMARRAAHPAKLETLAEALGITNQKDKRGAALIRKFSIPNKKTGKRTLPTDKPTEFQEFMEYCLQDVRTEQEVHKKLEAFIPTGPCLDTFLFDMRLNDRGLPVNVAALRNAQKLVTEIEEGFGKRFVELTGGIQPGQRDALLRFVQKYGYPFDNLRAPTVEAALDDTDWAKSRHVVEVLELRQKLAFAAVKKIPAMLECQHNGIIRGTLQYYGAGTGRAAGRLIQPQNFKRPSFKDTALSYRMICEGTTVEDLDMLYGNPMEAIASSIRHFIQLPNGQMMLNADYAGIEARIVPWLADDFTALREFEEYDMGIGPNAYELMASAIFDIPIDKIDKDGIERFIGKQTVLGCGFGMGVDKFIVTCANNGREIDYDLGEKAVTMFRKVRSKVVKLWRDCDNAARRAINNPGEWQRAGTKIKFAVTESNGIEYLVMQLPSKRRIVYPWPKIEKLSKTKKQPQITFYGQLPHKAAWGRVSTYGGKLVENATQATAADIMFNGAVKAERAGFDILTLIHDEALAALKDGQTVKQFTDALCDTPAWAAGLPIVAEGKIVPYYLK